MSTSGGSGGGSAFNPGNYPLVESEFAIQGTAAGSLIGLSSNLFTIADPVTGFSTVFAFLGTSLPTLVAALSPIINLADMSQLVGPLDTPNAGFQFEALLSVADLTGSNLISVLGSADIPSGQTAATALIDWSTASVQTTVGADLTFDPAVGISTTAGGVFVVSVEFNGSWF